MFHKERTTWRWYGGSMGASIIVLRMECALEAVMTCPDRRTQNMTCLRKTKQTLPMHFNLEVEGRGGCGTPHGITLPHVRRGHPGPFYRPYVYMVFGGACVEILITVMVVLSVLGNAGRGN